MRKRTKIIATISDRHCEPVFLKELFDNGMNVVRLNTAHQKPADSLKVINNVRAVSDTIAILLDTKGPEIRTTELDEKFEVKTGEKIKIFGDPNRKTIKGEISVS